MKLEVLEVWPWAAEFFKSKNALALEILSEVMEDFPMKTGNGVAWDIAKAMDLIR
jgi:hypothetical protein